MAKAQSKATKRKKNLKLASGVLHVQTSENNTIVTLTDDQGNKIVWWWTWLVWFKWSKENTPYAAEMLTKHVLKDAKDHLWLKEIWVVVQWVGMWRDWVFKAINEIGLIDIKYIKDTTAVQFWGCKWIRPKRM